VAFAYIIGDISIGKDRFDFDVVR